jgi:plastocyanin
MTRRVSILAVALIALTLGLAACGGDDNGEQPAANGGGGGGEATTLALAADPDGGLSFDQTSLEAPAGEITIEFTNDASIPHNVTLEGVEGGATETITASTASVTVELEPGTYTYFCSVGNHRQGGMEGTLTVQ